jgi:hypothetical protein
MDLLKKALSPELRSILARAGGESRRKKPGKVNISRFRLLGAALTGREEKH